MGSFKQQEFTSPQFWSLKVPDEAASQAVLSLQPLGEDPCWPFPSQQLLAIFSMPWLADSHSGPYLFHGIFPVHHSCTQIFLVQQGQQTLH